MWLYRYRIHANSCNETLPSALLLPWISEIIIQSLNLTDTIIDDSNSMELVTQQSETILADSFGQDRSPALIPHVTQQVIRLCNMIAATF
jgi:hypothetical protein